MKSPELVTRKLIGKTVIASGSAWYSRDMPKTRQQVEEIADLCRRTLEAFDSDEEYAHWAGAEIYAAMDEEMRRYKGNLPPGCGKSRHRGFVYLMRDNRSGLFKIGWSKNPKVREETLLSQCPDIELIWKKEGTGLDEKALHERYAALRVRGEWFRLTSVELAQIAGANV